MTFNSASPLLDTYDIAIVGCGPVGATLAGLLGARGWKVAVFDKSREIFPLPRAVALDHEVMRAFQAIGDIDRLLPHTAPYRPSLYLGCDRQPILRFDIAPPPFPLGWRPNYTFNQPELEGWQRDRVSSIPTVGIHLGVEVDSVKPGADCVFLSLTGDSSRSVEANFVVGCDGATSMVRRAMGTNVVDLQFDERWIVIDMILSEEAQARLPDTNIQYCEPQRPTTYVVLPGNHRRWELMINAGDLAEELLEPAALWRLLADWVAPHEGQIWRAATYRFHAVVAERWRSGRIFLAGDSAHQMPPFLGQGMCQGIRDAANLEWKLDLFLKGHGSETLLDSYESERKNNVIELTTTVKTLGKLICERDPVAARRRDLELLEAQGGVIRTTIRQDLIPGLKIGIVSQANSCAGTVFPQPLVCSSDKKPFMLDDLTGNSFRIVVRRGQNLATELSEDPIFRLHDAVFVECHDDGNIAVEGVMMGADTDRQLSQWFARNNCIAAVVRPDGYVFGTVASLSDLPQLLAELSSHTVGR